MSVIGPSRRRSALQIWSVLVHSGLWVDSLVRFPRDRPPPILREARAVSAFQLDPPLVDGVEDRVCCRTGDAREHPPPPRLAVRGLVDRPRNVAGEVAGGWRTFEAIGLKREGGRGVPRLPLTLGGDVQLWLFVNRGEAMCGRGGCGPTAARMNPRRGSRGVWERGSRS